LQLAILGFGLLEDGDVWTGFCPEREEVLVSGFSHVAVAQFEIGFTSDIGRI